MKRLTWLLSTAVSASLLSSSPLTSAQSHVFTPQSSLPQPPNANGDIMARTQLRIYVPPTGQKTFGPATARPGELPPFPGYFFETPASIACVYELVETKVRGCNPNVTTTNPTGGNHAIAIVDAYDDPTAASDLSIFDTQFGLRPANFTVVYAQGTKPATDPTGGWEVEEALDTQWSHALAPEAKLYLVEAADNSFTNLFAAVAKASSLVAAAGGGEVSMSWGGDEFTQETSYDSYFTTRGVVYFASTGDSAGVIYPSTSPNVVAAGGTSLSRNPYTGEFLLEDAWQDGGGGQSQVESRPVFQDRVAYVVGSVRGTPDLSFDANPATGVWVYNDNAVSGNGWYVVGGTSVASPSLAGIVNSADSFRNSSQAENTDLYLGQKNDFNDIVYGNCGLNMANFTQPGYDLCTGIGSVKTLRGK